MPELRNLADGRLACLNTATLGHREPIEAVIDEVARAGFGAISPWRRDVEGHDVAAIARRIRDAGLTLPGYCRSTYLPATTPEAFRANVEDNRRAIGDAATLCARSFVMVVGGVAPGSKDLGAARAQVRDGTALLLEHGREAGVRIALEPLHPMYAGDRSCLNTLAQALDLCDSLDPEPGADPWLGVVVDVYHTWWDPDLAAGIARAGRGRRIMGFHVCDWLVPTTDLLLDRGMMGDGVIDIRLIRGKVEAAGYLGPTEVEIFSAANWWRREAAEVLRICRERLASAT